MISLSEGTLRPGRGGCMTEKHNTLAQCMNMVRQRGLRELDFACRKLVECVAWGPFRYKDLPRMRCSDPFVT
jgi:hypothetical protein